MPKRTEYQRYCVERIVERGAYESESLEKLNLAMKMWGDIPLCAKYITEITKAFRTLAELREMLLSCEEYDDDFSLMLTFTLNKRRQIYTDVRPQIERLIMVLKALRGI